MSDYSRNYGHHAWEPEPNAQKVSIQVGREVLALARNRGADLIKSLMTAGKNSGLGDVAMKWLRTTLLGDVADWPRLAEDQKLALRVIRDLIFQHALAMDSSTRNDSIPTPTDLMAVDEVLKGFVRVEGIRLAEGLATDLNLVCRRHGDRVLAEAEAHNPAWWLKHYYLWSVKTFPRIYAPHEDELFQLAKLAGQGPSMRHS